MRLQETLLAATASLFLSGCPGEKTPPYLELQSGLRDPQGEQLCEERLEAIRTQLLKITQDPNGRKLTPEEEEIAGIVDLPR